MMNFRKICCILCVTALLILVLPGFCLAQDATPAQAPASLSFGEDGMFTVLVLSDLQSTQFISPHLIRSLNGLFNNVSADLVVLLGDQLEGSSPFLRLGSDMRNVQKTLTTLLAPIAQSGIPFVAVFGNHDYEAPVSVAQQLAIFEQYPNYLGTLSAADGAKNAYGNYVQSIPVMAADGSGDIAMNLYLFDCGPSSSDGDYGAISREQVDWYNAETARLQEADNGTNVPGVAFSHIALPEVYELFTEVPAETEGAIAGVGSGADQYYLLESEKFFIGEAGELPCPSSVNNGLFDAFLGNDDVFLYVSGHDHVNTFIGSLKGVDLASVPGATFTSYNNRAVRGVRLFRFREEAIRDYDTMLVPFSAFDGADGIGAVSYYLTTTTGIYKAYKVLFLSALIIGVLALLVVKLFQSDSGSGVMEDMPLEDESFEQPENDWL